MVAVKLLAVLLSLSSSALALTAGIPHERRVAHNNRAAALGRRVSDVVNVNVTDRDASAVRPPSAASARRRKRASSGRCKAGGPPQASPSSAPSSTAAPENVEPAPTTTQQVVVPSPLSPPPPPVPTTTQQQQQQQQQAPPPPPPAPSPQPSPTTQQAPPPSPPPPPPASSPAPAPAPAPSPSAPSNSGGGGDDSQTFTGDATFYAPGLGACGFTNGPDDLIVAVAHELFDTFPGYTNTANPNSNPICGKQATASVNGNSVTVTIVDRCGGCDLEGSLDFSPAAFNKLADPSVGRVHGMTWHFD